MKLADLPLDYNYYPATMMALSAIAYSDKAAIPAAVQQFSKDLSVVWGPEEYHKLPHHLVSCSLAYVVYNSETTEYTVVIRGTKPTSLSSWLEEDFEVRTVVPFTNYVGWGKGNISKASADGLGFLSKLVDSGTGDALGDYFGSLPSPPNYLYVTGHSLGGTLTPALFAILNYLVYQTPTAEKMACWSFAGLTTGDKEFADYINTVADMDFAWRMVNPHDIAPRMFGSDFADFKKIYDPMIPWDILKNPGCAFLDILYPKSEGLSYTQPDGEYRLTNVPFISGVDWDDEAFAQHHATQYLKYVTLEFQAPAGGKVQAKGRAFFIVPMAPFLSGHVIAR